MAGDGCGAGDLPDDAGVGCWMDKGEAGSRTSVRMMDLTSTALDDGGLVGNRLGEFF